MSISWELCVNQELQIQLQEIGNYVKDNAHGIIQSKRWSIT